MATRRRIVSAKIADDGSDATYAIHGPADSAGKYPVVDTLSFAVSSIPASRLNWFALYGVSQVVSNSYNKLDDDVTPADIRADVSGILDAVRDGTWAPGRHGFAERDPTDLELALAEVQGLDVSDVMDRIDNEYEKADDGTLKLDAKGRRSKVFTKSLLAQIALDPAVAPTYARIVAERAKRLAADAKAGKGASTLGSLFGAPAAGRASRRAVGSTSGQGGDGLVLSPLLLARPQRPPHRPTNRLQSSAPHAIIPSCPPVERPHGHTPRPPIHLSLDTLVTRARGGVKLSRSPAPAIPQHQPRTLSQLERDASLNTALAERFVRPPTPPSALALWVTVATCACGRVHRLPPQTVLIRYGANEHSFHYKRDDSALDEAALALPREVHEKSVRIPFCEECFT